MAKTTIRLRNFRKEINQVLGSDLLGLTLYGHKPRKFLILVPEVTPKLLDRCSTLALAARKDKLFLFFADRDDILNSGDVFPVRYWEMVHTRLHLQGEDILESLEISEMHLKLRIEQELRQAVFHLRQCYFTAHHSPTRALRDLDMIMHHTEVAFLILKQRCEAALTLDEKLLEVDKDTPENQVRPTVGQALTLITQASRIADEWNS